ncbi:hypothetical protein MUK42_36283 [Musa troglodytarum]|uniref:Uncharacterized protein n=1 Tax=Musa troglodytarum TaxID=320322 RepID=A0A9E7HX08_9LILI|nr:hypothetical protein MUK42_36283 [Musa troglodytarum]
MAMIIIVTIMPRTTSMIVILLHTLWACQQIHTTRYGSMSIEGCLVIFVSAHKALLPLTVICYCTIEYVKFARWREQMLSSTFFVSWIAPQHVMDVWIFWSIP